MTSLATVRVIVVLYRRSVEHVVFVAETPSDIGIPMRVQTTQPTYEKILGAVGEVEEPSADDSAYATIEFTSPNIYNELDEPPPLQLATDDKSPVSPEPEKPKTKPKPTEKTRKSDDNNDYLQVSSHLSSVI